MIRVAFCDDDVSVLQQMDDVCRQYGSGKKRELDCRAFQSPLELLAEIERGTHFDVLFLDVLMPGENGIEAAREIRRYDSNVKIIFLTSSSEYAVDSYSVGAYYYLLKPIGQEKFFELMDSVLENCREEERRSMILRCKNGITRIDFRELEYCEVIHRTIRLHLTNGEVLETSGSMDELSSQLEVSGGFLRVHRSYLVNLEHVQNLSYQALTLASETRIPIPRGKYQQMKDAYLEYAFQTRRIVL